MTQTVPGPMLPLLDLPRAHLDDAVESAQQALARLQQAQETRWQSVLADRFRSELYLAIQDVREVQRRVDAADESWHRLVMTARACGQ